MKNNDTVRERNCFLAPALAGKLQPHEIHTIIIKNKNKIRRGSVQHLVNVAARSGPHVFTP